MIDRSLKVDRSRKESSKHVAIDTYLTSLQKIPQLKHAELVSLFEKYVAGRKQIEDDVYERTPEADRIRKKLIESNLRLVVSIAKQYKVGNISLEDLIQEGNIGLMKAIERFDHEKGFRFSTYATWWIKQSIGQFLLKNKRMIRLPAHAATIQRKLIQATEEFKEQTGTIPTNEELTEILGASEVVVNATIHSNKNIVSLNDTCGRSDGSDGNTYENRIVDDRPGVDPFDNVLEKQLIDVVSEVLSTLSPKESAVLRLRFGLVDDCIDQESYPITVNELEALKSGEGMQDP
jgi:RNA polymerase primary sigma factor